MGGISRYFYEIAKRMALVEDVYLYEGYYINKYGLNLEKQIKKCWAKENPQIKYTGFIFRYLTRRNFPDFVKNINVDIYHPTYYKDFNIDKGNLIVTVHDMIHELFNMNDGTIEDKKNLVDKAAGIICVSEWTKNDLINILGLKDKKIKVIHLANSLMGKVLNGRIIKEPYILYVGNRGSYKNFDKFLQAFAKSECRKEVKVICFGGGDFNNDEIQLITALGVKEKIQFISGNDDILANLYKYAEAFVFPSLYEGFGLPPLEAMHYGTPVIASNAASIPEVVGNAGMYFNAQDIEDMSYKIDKVLFDEALKKELQLEGFEREKLFSWDKCANETAEFYRMIGGNQ